MRKMPKFEVVIEDNTPGIVFEPYKVSMVSLGSFFKYDGVLYIVPDPTISKVSPDINIKSQMVALEDTLGRIKQLHYPVVCFDNTITLLMENISAEHKAYLYNNKVVPNHTTATASFLSMKVEFYDTQDVDLATELSIEGLEQLMKFYSADEDYDGAYLIKCAIEDDELLRDHDHELDPLNIVDSSKELANNIGIPFVVKESDE